MRVWWRAASGIGDPHDVVEAAAEAEQATTALLSIGVDGVLDPALDAIGIEDVYFDIATAIRAVAQRAVADVVLVALFVAGEGEVRDDVAAVADVKVGPGLLEGVVPVVDEVAPLLGVVGDSCGSRRSGLRGLGGAPAERRGGTDGGFEPVTQGIQRCKGGADLDGLL